ncbi:MAG: endonuclease III [Clostridiales bacterium]|nr:endonuclease III [Clostridiales bacterium]
MNTEKRAKEIVRILKENYPSTCSLEAVRDYELLFATRLSAQCTDARVNLVTPVLFRKFPDLDSFAKADLTEIEDCIKPCGLFHTKAKDLKLCAIALLENFGGHVPGTMEELLTLPGIGRKTANLILGDIFHKPAIVVDTHCIRITNRLGICNTRDPYKVETELKQIIEPDEQSDFCHRLVHFGRDICKAKKPECFRCPLKEDCPSANAN